MHISNDELRMYKLLRAIFYRPKYDMMTLSLHEGNPGHHLEASFSISLGNMPKFRMYMEDRRLCQYRIVSTCEI